MFTIINDDVTHVGFDISNVEFLSEKLKKE